MSSPTPHGDFKNMFNLSTRIITITTPVSTEVKCLAQEIAGKYLKLNPNDKVLILRTTKVDQVVEEEDLLCFKVKADQHPKDFYSLGRQLGISFEPRGGMDFGWYIVRLSDFVNLIELVPVYQRDTLAAKIAAGLVKIFDAQIAESQMPGAPVHDLQYIHDFQQKHVRALFASLGLEEPSFAEFMELMQFDSGFWDELYTDEQGDFSPAIKSEITKSWLKFASGCCTSEPLLVFPKAQKPLELLPVPMAAWLLQNEFIAEGLFNECVESALGGGVPAALFTQIVDSFPASAFGDFLRDFARLLLVTITGDSWDDYFLFTLLHARAVLPFEVVHVATPKSVYDDSVAGINMGAFWHKFMPGFVHKTLWTVAAIQSDAFDIVKSFPQALKEQGKLQDVKLAETAKRVARAQEWSKASLGDPEAAVEWPSFYLSHDQWTLPEKPLYVNEYCKGL